MTGAKAISVAEHAHNGVTVLSLDWGWGVSANPYLSFDPKEGKVGDLVAIDGRTAGARLAGLKARSNSPRGDNRIGPAVFGTREVRDGNRDSAREPSFLCKTGHSFVASRWR